MRRTGKEIFCRFRISNQIFGSIYGSRDIERSLDTTFAVFGQNLTFMDEYLEIRGSYGPAVFCKCFVMISSIILELFIKIVRAIFEKIAKNPSKMHKLQILWMIQIFFRKSGSVTSHTLSRSNIVQSFKKFCGAVFSNFLFPTNRQTFWVYASTRS